MRLFFKTLLCLSIMTVATVVSAYAAADSTKKIDINTLTRDDVAKMSNKDLVNLPFEDLMALADKLGVSVDDLLNMKVSVSSKKALSTREAPGIITVVTEEEIVNSGARDLVDVLRMVPGFEFGYDTQGATGIGVRGIWAEEGKVLLLVDGQEMNELEYSCMPIGNRFDVSQIKRIEILRGPGSCIYGGFAEASVINIITKKSDDINGAGANITYGQMQSAFGLANGTVEVGKFFKGGDFSVKAFGSTANRGDRDYTDPNTGYVYTMDNAGLTDALKNTDLMRLNAVNVNAGGSLNNLSGRFIYDFYQTDMADLSADGTAGLIYPVKFKTYLGEARYDLPVSDKLTITPKINYKGVSAWQTDAPSMIYDEFASRYTGNVLANYDYSDNLNVLGGFEGYLDDAAQKTSSYDTFPNGKKTIAYNNISAFGQGVFKTTYINFIVGGRVDKNNQFGWAFSPRLGVTGLLDKFHYKAIFSQAFRAPGIENIRVAKLGFGVDIKPERTTDFEGEMGYQLSNNMFITANVFDISIKDPIVYFIDTGASGGEGYKNFSHTGSSGFEVEYKTKFNWGYSSLNYSFSDPGLLNRNDVSLYEVPGRSDVMLAFPQHKVSLNFNYYLGKLSINPSGTFLSKRFTYGTDADGNAAFLQEPSLFLVNLYLRYNDLFVKGLALGAGVYDILNQQYNFIQPYQGVGSWPGPSRELVVRLTYALKM
ncbi:MAG: TonB-dependent receptor [Chitinivibrionales bacterium]|nr:TonB-dependent receptor [Chitinivibrionales bacterium]